jgi:hypothetical protein
MVELDFAVEQASVAPHAATPLLLFALRVTNRTPEIAVQNVLLRCQIRIEPLRRRYAEQEQEPLSDLFGAPSRWSETLRSFLWTHTGAQIPAFANDCTVELPVPCSYDFNLAATKYFYGLEDGEAPLSLLFSGSIFYRDQEERLQIDQVSWTREANFRLPVRLWHEMMNHYYADAAWLCLRRDAFEQLYRYKRQHGLATFEQAIEALIAVETTEPRR